MTNWNFNRGLSDKFVKQFNELYEDAGGKWLKNLVDDPGIFFAIRENYATFYYRGCSLLRLECASRQEDKIVGHIHYKYLLNPSIKPEYLKDLRQRAAEDPKVIHQMNGYAEILKTHKTRIAKCYTMACKNLLALRGVYERKECQTELLERVANNDAPLTVNVEPRLVVFGYDDDQARGKTWGPHLDKLKRILDDRVLFMGDPKRIVLR